MATWINPRVKVRRMKLGDLVRETHSDNLPVLIVTELTKEQARLTNAQTGAERWIDRLATNTHELVARNGKAPSDPGWVFVK